MDLELRTAVMYEKPRIAEVSYEVEDSRGEGGTVVLQIVVEGDPGLTATFDISPDIVSRAPMMEKAAGVYAGRYAFSPETVGGPFTVIGRLEHERAGEVVLRDPNPLIISLFR